MILRSRAQIRRVLPRLKTATVPGQTGDGARIMLKYKPAFPRTVQQKKELQEAKARGLDLMTYSGSLDRVWVTKRGKTCFTLLVTERLKGGHYTYRTFNLDDGQIIRMVVL